MFNKKVILATLLAVVSGPVLADEMVKNYVTGTGNVVKSGAGECWRTSYKDTAEKKVECGYPAPAAADAKTVVVTEEIVVAPTAVSVTATVDDKIVISAAVLFEFDSAALSSDGKAIIDERIATYKGRAKNTVDIMVVGHTDSTGPEAYNQALSERRAQAVAEYLESHTDLPDEEIEVIGKGESDPVADNSTREGRAMNRRVDIGFAGVITK